jgi:cell cycle related kinase
MPPLAISLLCPDASTQATDLLRQFLVYRSAQRISASTALLDDYFFNKPLPAHHLELPIPKRKLQEQFNVDKELNFSLFLAKAT